MEALYAIVTTYTENPIVPVATIVGIGLLMVGHVQSPRRHVRHRRVRNRR